MAVQAVTRNAELMAKRARQAGMLLERAYDMACDPNVGEACRLGAMKLYLSKTLPDLKAVEVSGGMDVQITAVELRVIDPAR